MGEHLLKIATDELAVIRVTCKKCGTCVELDRKQLGYYFDQLQCRFCKADLAPGEYMGVPSPLAELAKALDNVDKLANVRVEFQIPATSN